MGHQGALAVQVLVSVLVCLCSPSPITTFLEQPQDTLVNSGSEARLSCRTRRGSGSCQWMRDGYGLGTEPHLPHLPRYSMPGAAAGNCHLIISPVLPLDAGTYTCQAGGVQSQPAELQVNVAPGQPHILEARDGGRLQVEPGHMVELTCQSQGGRPFAELHWTDGQGRRIQAEDVEEHVTRIQDSSMFKTVSKLKLLVEESIVVICTAHSESFPTLRHSAPLDIMVGSEPELEVVKVVEGQTFTLECGDQANEVVEDFTFKWMVDDREVEGEEEESLKMIDFTARFDRSVVECQGTDGEGRRRVLRRFQLEQSEPRSQPSSTGRRLKSRSRKGDKRTTVTCVLDQEEQEGGEPEYVWVAGNLERVAGKVVGAVDGEERKYRCKVIPGGYNKLRVMAGKMKEMTKTIKRLSRNLNKITRLEDL